MTALLLALVVAQPMPDESAHVQKTLAARMGEAYRVMGEDPEGAIRLMTAVLDDPKGRELEPRSATIRAFRDQALYLRGQLQIERGGAQAVADDMTALLERKRGQFGARVAALVGGLASPHAPLAAVLRLPPWAPLNRTDEFAALSLRAEAYRRLDRHEAAQADRAEVIEILRASQPGRPSPPSPGQLGAVVTGPPSPLSPLVGSLIVASSFFTMLPVFLLTGMRQRRDGGGTWRRLFWVASAMAVLQTTPLLAALLLLLWRPELFPRAALPSVAVGVFVLNIVRHVAYLGAVKWQQAREAPPLLEDPAVLDRIDQIARRIGIAPPVTRLVRSPTSLQANNALVVGLAAPTMVLFDGILYRLAEEERDAIIAHELAHLANRTFWLRLVGGAACGVVAVALGAFCPVLVACSVYVALLLGTWLILSRRLELDCDRRAARAIGHRRAFSALAKIHTDQPFVGVLEFLIGALATHPSRDERLDAVRRDAPEGDRPAVEWDAGVLRNRRLASLGAALSWLGVLAGCVLWACLIPGSNWPALPPALMVAGLCALSFVGLRVLTRRNRLLQRTRRGWTVRLTWLVAVLVWAYFLAEIAGLIPASATGWAYLAVMGSALALWMLFRLLGSAKATQLNQRILIAIQSNDYPKALALAEGKPALVARSTELRYNYALIRVVLGRREEALIDLERLRADDPGFKMTSLLMVGVYADEGDYARALELAEQLSRDLPRDPVGPQAESWLLRKLGRPEEAERRARDALAMDPRSGPAHLTLGGVALDRGDHVSAREELARAEKFVPGSTDAALFAAEIAMASGDPGAEAAVRRAVDAAKNNPLSFSDKEAARLARRLHAGGRGAPEEAIPPAVLPSRKLY